MFHIAVENSFSENWYTEKIGQAFISKTLPIYWGCPNLEDIGYDERMKKVLITGGAGYLRISPYRSPP
jgi:hypothetical protein